MRLVNYTNDEIRENINNLVFLDIHFNGSEYQLKKPVIIKVTEKQFKTSNLGSRTVRFSDVGYLSYRSGFFIKEDVESVIGVYQRRCIDDLEQKIKEAKAKIEQIKKLKENENENN